MDRVRNTFFIRFLWGIMGLYLLNISIDTIDPQPENIPEDLNFNDQESIVELIVEKVMGFEDAIEEYDDADTENEGKKNNVKIDIITLFEGNKGNVNTICATSNHKFPAGHHHLSNGFYRLSTPPPKA